MVLRNHVDGADTRFVTMSVPLVNTLLGKFHGVIRIGSYQTVAEDKVWAYEAVSDLWIDI